jgi:hypothetical protein
MPLPHRRHRHRARRLTGKKPVNRRRQHPGHAPSAWLLACSVVIRWSQRMICRACSVGNRPQCGHSVVPRVTVTANPLSQPLLAASAGRHCCFSDPAGTCASDAVSPPLKRPLRRPKHLAGSTWAPRDRNQCGMVRLRRRRHAQKPARQNSRQVSRSWTTVKRSGCYGHSKLHMLRGVG